MDEQDRAHAESPLGASPIEHELVVAVSRTRAWDAYVHGLGEWWHPGWTATGSGLDHIEIDPRHGSRIVEHGRDGREVVWGEVTESVPGECFAHTFRLPRDGDESIVSVTFAALPGGGTRVRITLSGWSDADQPTRRHADWPLLLERYRAYAQHV